MDMMRVGFVGPGLMGHGAAKHIPGLAHRGFSLPRVASILLGLLLRTSVDLKLLICIAISEQNPWALATLVRNGGENGHRGKGLPQSNLKGT